MSSGKTNKPRLHKVKKADTKSHSKLSDRLLFTGFIFIALSLALFGAIFWPVLREELNYLLRKGAASSAPPQSITPVSEEFGIVIPKIGANAKVIADVNPFDSNEYQRALTQGVAHADGSAKPGSSGNVFLFSHSSVNFYEAARYNSVFYLINKLTEHDPIDLYYNGVQFRYTVTKKQLVSPTSTKFMLPKSGGVETLTLMTCWPPGTTQKRLLIIAERLP